MDSTPEESCSVAENLRQYEEKTDDEQQRQHSRRQQRRLDMQLQQKKKSNSGGKCEKRRQVGSNEDEDSEGDNQGEDATPLPTYMSVRDGTAARVPKQNDKNPPDEDDEVKGNRRSFREAMSHEHWEHDRQPPIIGPVSVVYCGVCGMPSDYCEFGSQWKRCKAWLEEHHPALLQYALPPEELAAAEQIALEKGVTHSQSSSSPAEPTHVLSFQSSGSLGSSGAAAGDLAEQLAENLRLSAAATQEVAAALGLDAAEDLSVDAQPAGLRKKATKGKAPAQPSAGKPDTALDSYLAGSVGDSESESAVVSIQRQSRAKRKTMTVIVGLDFFGVKLPNATKIFSKRFACGASVSKNPLGHPPQQVEVQGDVEEAIVEVIESVFNVPSEKIVVLPRK